MQVRHRRSNHRQHTAPVHSEFHPRTEAAGDLRPLDSGDLMAFVAEKITIAEGDRLRSVPCLLCRNAIGAVLAQVVTLVSCTTPPDGFGRLVSRAYLIHAAERPADDMDLHRAAHCLENPGCHCGFES